MDPTFAPFCALARRRTTCPSTLVSDGFGFYIGPLLERGGLGHLRVITNRSAGTRTGVPTAWTS